MIYSFKLYLQDKHIYGTLALATLIQAITWFLVTQNIHPGTESFFLHYTIVFGIDLIGTWGQAMMPAMVGLGLLVVNPLLAWLTYGSSRYLARLIMVFLCLIEIALLMGQWQIISLNR